MGNTSMNRSLPVGYQELNPLTKQAELLNHRPVTSYRIHLGSPGRQCEFSERRIARFGVSRAEKAGRITRPLRPRSQHV